MGDVLLATPLIRYFNEIYPDIEIDVLAERVPAQPLLNNPHITNIQIAPDRGSPIHHYLPVVRSLRKRRYSILFDVHGTPGSALLSRLTGAPVRVGFERRGRGWSYTHTALPVTGTVYAPAVKFALLAPVGIKAPILQPPTLLPRIYLTEEAEIRAEEWLEELGIVEGDRVIGLAPFCRKPERMMKAERWVDLLKELPTADTLKILLFATEGERESLEPIERHSDRNVIWAGAGDLHLAAGMMKRCVVLVGGENGLLHLAVAAGVPTYSVFVGRDDPVRWVPDSERHRYADLRGKEITAREVGILALDIENLLDTIEGDFGIFRVSP
jgi:ADP-heptose:LPS heptosyltransferase